METSCGSLLSELQTIWDEIGEPDDERDKMLFELEQECLDAYRRKVDQARRCQVQLRQSLADCEAQLADICGALGDLPVNIKKISGTLKKELLAIMPQLEDMKKKKTERKGQFAEVKKQINCILKEFSGSTEEILDTLVIDDSDLSLKKLEDLQNKLLLLQKEKSERLKQVAEKLKVLNYLCLVLGMDFKLTICNIHPTLDGSRVMKSISGDTIESLHTTICRLKDVKLQRMQKLQDLAVTMIELWNLMDTPVEEQQKFHNVTSTIAASENEITEPDILSLEFLNNAEAEVARLEELKFSKMKEVLLKKKLVLEEICRGSHMIVEERYTADLSVEAIESGETNPSYLLEQMEVQISKVKEEAFSRKEILEKVKKWLAACEEECWLEEYNRDGSRYNAGRGTHLMLKRAEKARSLVGKIPVMVETLKTKVSTWEKDKETEFLYDGVGLLSMIEQYRELNQLKELDRQRQRDQKKLQGQLMVEQEALFGSKQSPSRSGSKNFRPSTGGVANKKFSVGGAMLQSIFTEKSALSSLSLLKNNPVKQQQGSRSHHHGGFMAHSSGNKHMTSCHGKHHSVNAATSSQHCQMSPMRKPLSPITSLSSNIIPFNFQDQNAESGVTSSFSTTPLATPTKNAFSFNENRTPTKMQIPMPATPPTVSITMQTATTPFTPCIRDTEEVEYSYEERRSGFIVSKSTMLTHV
ncbi:65-kDa microtubule-associated protein 9-like [Primulina eburnea]|uniref:65-kDa microtubule-associated protein 9-like n=1 Tax=Primulina eburnea TaxID=1245227 RepID=UPI003C6C3BBC